MTRYRLFFTCLAFAAVPLWAQAQTMGGSFGGGTSGAGGIGGAAGSFGSSGGVGVGGGGGTTTGGSFLGTGSGTGASSGFLSTPGPGQLGQAATAGIKTTTSADIFAPYYVNPMAMGNVIPGTSTAITQFGLPLYNSLYPGSQITSIFSSSPTTTTSTRSIPPTTNLAPNNFGTVGYKAPPTYITSLGFSYQPPTPPKVKEAAQAVLTRSSTLPKDLTVMMDGPTVVLQGKVADASQRRLAENLVKLTPGVSAVRNELQVAAPAKAGQ